jgi:hypothetical protein
MTLELVSHFTYVHICTCVCRIEIFESKVVFFLRGSVVPFLVFELCTGSSTKSTWNKGQHFPILSLEYPILSLNLNTISYTPYYSK